jgi:hypothetical protein
MDMPKQTQHPFYPLELELSQIADKVGGKVSLINQVRLANRKAKAIHHNAYNSLTIEEKIAITQWRMCHNIFRYEMTQNIFVLFNCIVDILCAQLNFEIHGYD